MRNRVYPLSGFLRSRFLLDGSLLGRFLVGGLLPAIALGLLSIALAAGHAHAGILQIQISEGGTSYTIFDEGALDTLTGPGNNNKIQALAGALIFPDYKIIGLNAATNDPGTSIGADLTIGGEVETNLLAGPEQPADTFGSAVLPLIITATDTDYTFPPGGVLQSSMSETDTAVPAGNVRTFESWFNPTNVPYANDIPQGTPIPLAYASTGLAPNSGGSTAALKTVTPVTLFGLTNTTTINLNGSASDIVFNGATLVTPIPEPTAIALAACTVLLLATRRMRSGLNVPRT
jgi:hypothetical protein